MARNYDLTYEVDSIGECGSIASVDAHGHLDDRDVELFMADVVAREMADSGYLDDEPLTFGFEVEHLHRREVDVPYDEDEGIDAHHVFVYSDEPREGAIPVTRFQIAHTWTRLGTDEPLMCINHPDEPATTGMPESWFTDAGPDIVIDGNVHYCRPCSARKDDEIREARRKALAELKEAAA